MSAVTGRSRPAAFLDRDGTIIDDVNYIARPEDVRLLPGVAEAIRLLNEREVSVVVITNQSGLARGYFTLDAYEAVRRRLEELLATGDAHIDATYYCPHFPDVSGPCDCRKPGTLLYERAIADLGLDPAASMFVGDRVRDVAPAKPLGGAAFLIRDASTPAADVQAAGAMGAAVVDSLLDATRRYLAAAVAR